MGDEMTIFSSADGEWILLEKKSPIQKKCGMMGGENVGVLT